MISKKLMVYGAMILHSALFVVVGMIVHGISKTSVTRLFHIRFRWISQQIAQRSRKVGEVGVKLEAGKEMDRCCVLGWLNEVYRHPTVAFNTYSDEQQIEFAHDALVLLKDQEAVHWIKCTDRLPNADGDYLVVVYNKIDVCKFALNLHKMDKFDFLDETRPGWYEYDSESGYFERTAITHWAELPKMPNVER